ncbi:MULTISPECIES: hypothetical protein [Shewanella]|nr:MULTISPECIES: hypothetical protein [Shewanella]MCI2964255.1 hypothetical protein [Shewanella sp. N2AIL]
MNNIVGVGKLLMTIPVGNILGEGVLWDDKTQSIIQLQLKVFEPLPCRTE